MRLKSRLKKLESTHGIGKKERVFFSELYYERREGGEDFGPSIATIELPDGRIERRGSQAGETREAWRRRVEEEFPGCVEA